MLGSLVVGLAFVVAAIHGFFEYRRGTDCWTVEVFMIMVTFACVAALAFGIYWLGVGIQALVC